MLASFKTLVSGLLGRPRGSLRDDDGSCRVATAALLVRVAGVDGEISDARRNRLRAALKSCFDCDDVATDELMARAAMVSSAAVDLYRFTARINRLADEDGRRRVVRMMWDVLFADGTVSPIESNMVWRAADLLGVPSRQRVALRHRAAVERAAAAS